MHLPGVVVDDAQRGCVGADRVDDRLDEDGCHVAGRERTRQAGGERLQPLRPSARDALLLVTETPSSATAPCWKIALAMARIPESSTVGAR